MDPPSHVFEKIMDLSIFVPKRQPYHRLDYILNPLRPKQKHANENPKGLL